MKPLTLNRLPRFAVSVLFALFTTSEFSLAQQSSNQKPASSLADLSGMVWIEDDLFIAVHDAKVADENSKPRVCRLDLPNSLRGITFKDFRSSFRGVTPNDLESVSRIPGKKQVLLVESGDSKNAPSIQRIFKASVTRRGIKITNVTPWPVEIHNVEATAVAKLKGKYFFLFAERADNESNTELKWIQFSPDKMEFDHKVYSMKFDSPDTQRYNRVIVGMDVDQNGYLYTVSAFDAEAAGLPNPDNGPFAAGVYASGRIQLKDGQPSVELFTPPLKIASVEGFKVETVAVRETTHGGAAQLFIGTDDENYGGTLRQLPAPILND